VPVIPPHEKSESPEENKKDEKHEGHEWWIPETDYIPAE